MLAVRDVLSLFLLANYTFPADLTRSVYFHLLFHCHYFPYFVLVFVFKFNCILGNHYFWLGCMLEHVKFFKCLWGIKNNCCLFERLLRVKKNDVFLFGISCFVLEIFTESDDVICGSTRTAQHSIDNNSRNIEAMFFQLGTFKLGTSNVHRKRNTITPTILLPWQHSWLQSLSVKNQISPFTTF